MFKRLCLDIITGRAVGRSLCWNKVSMEEITTLWNIFHLSSRFLREELSSTQLSLLSSRSEVSTLLEELTTYRSGKEWKEEFPDLLLSSLDKLYQDKQQQLYLVRKFSVLLITNSSFFLSLFIVTFTRATQPFLSNTYCTPNLSKHMIVNITIHSLPWKQLNMLWWRKVNSHSVCVNSLGGEIN